MSEEEVIKANTTLTVDPIDDVTVGDSVNITGKLTDEKGNPIKGAEISVFIDGVEYPTTTDKYGKYSVAYTATEAGAKLVSVEFVGNDEYEPDAVAEVLSVSEVEEPKINTTLTVNPIGDVTVGDSVNITGQLTDEDGNPIKGAKISVIVDGVEYPTMTGKRGKYSVSYTATEVGAKLVTVEFVGDDDYEPSAVAEVLSVSEVEEPKINTTLTVNPIGDVTVGDSVDITGKLTDKGGKPIPDALLLITVDGVDYNITTHKDGTYTLNVPTTTTGNKLVTVEYEGNDTYNPKATATMFPVNDKEKQKTNTTLTVNPIGDIPVDSSVKITGKLTDDEGKPISGADVLVVIDDVEYHTKTNSKGKFSLPYNATTTGVKVVAVEYLGTDDYEPSTAVEAINVVLRDATITLKPISDALVDDNISITGKLLDSDGNPITYSNITIKVNDETYIVPTDGKGKYKLVMPIKTVGENDITVTFENDKYNTVTNETTFQVNKHKTVFTVYDVMGIVGEDITLRATITDEKGNPVTGGNMVFKLNGLTLREDGRFASSDSPVKKFKVVNGVVIFTMKADYYLKGTRNLTGAYSGSYKYESTRANIAEMTIIRRSVELEVKVNPTLTREDSDIVFTVKVRDVTENSTTDAYLTKKADIIFKINDQTLKDEEGQIIKVPVTDKVVTYTYHVPRGTPGIDSTGALRNYTVKAIYNSTYYVPVGNTTTYNVERSPVNVNFESVSLKGNTLSIKANFTDYNNNLLVGKNNVSIKINGQTYKENNQTRYFETIDGIPDFSGITIDKGTVVKSVTVVTGERQAYLGARVTTTYIKGVTGYSYTLESGSARVTTTDIKTS